MTTASKPYFGYEVRIPAGVSRRGLTTDPERTLAEYREQLGPSAYIRVLTSPLSLNEARQWERLMKGTRGYHQANGRRDWA